MKDASDEEIDDDPNHLKEKLVRERENVKRTTYQMKSLMQNIGKFLMKAFICLH